MWVASIYPALIVASFYATWLTAWCVLGHRPRVSLDDPKYISPIVDGVAAIPFMLLKIGLPLIWLVLAPIVLAVVGWDLAKKETPARRGDLQIILIPVGAWLFAYVFLLCDPGQVVEWYID